MRVAFFCPYPRDLAPGQRFRFELFFTDLEKKGISYFEFPLITSGDYKILYNNSKLLQKLTALSKGLIARSTLLFKLSTFDYIFIFRETYFFGPPIFELMIAKILRKKIIYDFDDAIWLADKNESNIWKWLKWRSKVKWICKWSYKVSVGNEFLADFAGQYCDQVEVIPTVVDTKVHSPVSTLPPSAKATEGRRKAHGDISQKPKAKSQKPTIGWTGSHSTLFYLDLVVPVLQELEKNHEFTFLVIANKNPELPLKNFRFIPWNKKTEIEDLAQIDIGIMPLEDTEWAKGKCGFKLIQYLALEIPAVASPVGVNPNIIKENETGFLAINSIEWKQALKNLLENESLRKQMGQNGRRLIINNYSVESQKEKFISLFS